MISKYKMKVLKEHLINERESGSKPYVFRHKYMVFMEVMVELEVAGLVEVFWKEEKVVSTRITPAGVLGYLRARGRAVSEKGNDYFKGFVTRNPGFLDRCGPIQRERVMKYLVLGYMPSFSKKAQDQGQQDKETQP